MPPKDLPDWIAYNQVQLQPFDWTTVSDPGALTRAVATVSRGATVKPVLAAVTAILWISAAGSAAFRVNVWDGGETGNLTWSRILAVPSAGVVDRLVENNLAIRNVGMLGLAGVLTVSFDAAPGANVTQIVSIAGYDA